MREMDGLVNVCFALDIDLDIETRLVPPFPGQLRVISVSCAISLQSR